MAEETRVPVEMDAPPLVQAAAALRLVIRSAPEAIEGDQRRPNAVVEPVHAAGFSRLLIPRALGGLQADPLTSLRVVARWSEGAGSVGWHLAHHRLGHLLTRGLSDEGVHAIDAPGADAVLAGTAVPGGGQAVPGAGGSSLGACAWPCWGCRRTQVLRPSPPQPATTACLAAVPLAPPPRRDATPGGGACPAAANVVRRRAAGRALAAHDPPDHAERRAVGRLAQTTAHASRGVGRRCGRISPAAVTRHI